MEKSEIDRYLVSCHRQQQELLSSLLDKVLGLPTLDMGIPGRPHLPSRPFPSLPFPPSFSPPLPPSRSPWVPPVNQLGGLGSDASSPSGSGAKP